MAIFRHKKESPAEVVAAQVDHFIDEEFREEMRAHGRLYFERIINENSKLFKQDLDETITHVNTELNQHMAKKLEEQFSEITKSNAQLREHITKRLDEQFAEYGQTVKEAQDTSLQSLNSSTQALQAQHQQLSVSLQKNIADQETMLRDVIEENRVRIAEMKDAQDVALQTLNGSVQALQTQYEQLSELLQNGVVEQQAMLIGAFEKNMALIVEHYVLGAVGDQYDMKAQLPMIIQQMETNKKAIMEDMRL